MSKRNTVLIIAILIVLTISALFARLWLSSQQPYDFKTLDGRTFTHSELQGDIIVVNYFAQWCAPCLREIPELNEFYHQATDKVKLFGVSFDNLTEQQLAALKIKHNIEFPLISYIATDFAFEKPQYLPATFIIEPSGDVAVQLLGEQSSLSLQKAISVIEMN